MPKSNNPYDLINALEERYNELVGEDVYSATDITAAYEVDLLPEHYGETDPDFDALFDKIVNYNIATADEISLVCAISGWTIENLNEIIKVRTGYDDIESYLGEVYPE